MVLKSKAERDKKEVLTMKGERGGGTRPYFLGDDLEVVTTDRLDNMPEWWKQYLLFWTA